MASGPLRANGGTSVTAQYGCRLSPDLYWRNKKPVIDKTGFFVLDFQAKKQELTNSLSCDNLYYVIGWGRRDLNPHERAAKFARLIASQMCLPIAPLPHDVEARGIEPPGQDCQDRAQDQPAPTNMVKSQGS